MAVPEGIFPLWRKTGFRASSGPEILDIEQALAWYAVKLKADLGQTQTPILKACLQLSSLLFVAVANHNQVDVASVRDC